MTKKQRKFSIKNKILALVLGCSVLALLLYSTVSLTVNYHATMENSKKYSNDMLNQLSISITTYLSAIDNQVFSCLFNSLTQQHLRLLYSHKDNSVYAADSSQYIQNLLYIMSTSLEDCSFHLFMENGSNQSFHVNNPSSTISAWYDFHEDDWYQQVQKIPQLQSKTMASLQKQSYYNSTLEGVVIIYRIVNANNLSTMGYLLVDIPKSNLAELVAKNLNNNFSILILSEINEVLYDSTSGIGAEITGKGVSAGWEKVYRTSRGSYSTFQHQVDFAKWTLIGVIPYSYHLQGFF